jgi:hypothetical protein
MKSIALFAAICAAALSTGVTQAAHAATITETYDFTATFLLGPISTWDGSFTITFDPTSPVPSGPLPLDAFSSNLPASYGTFMYAQEIGGSAAGGVTDIGNHCSLGTCTVVLGTNQARFDFFADASGNTFNGAGSALITTTNPTFIEAGNSTTTLTSTTPLPAALPLFATGLGALGLLGWRRKRKARVFLHS